MADLTPSHLEAIHPESRKWLARLAERSWSLDAYLAGSAALALYLNHRPVRDLDLMTPANRLSGPERRDLLADLLEGRAVADGSSVAFSAGGAAALPTPWLEDLAAITEAQVGPLATWSGQHIQIALDEA